MGRLLLVGRLASRDLRRRPLEAGLLLLAILAATTTLALGLVLGGVTDAPYESTRAATAGPDVVAGSDARGLIRLNALKNATGVVAHSGPYPVVEALVTIHGRSVAAYAQGRDAARARVDQPDLTEGTWLREGGVVLEAAFADALGVGTGDRITLAGVRGFPPTGPLPPTGPISVNSRSFTVVGVAVTAATPPYPAVPCVGVLCIPGGVVWLTRADVRDLAARPNDMAYTLNLKLVDPDTAPAFANAHVADAPAMTSWQSTKRATAGLLRNERKALKTGGWLLGVLAVASVAVLVGGRMNDQIPRIGLLKAVGGTPATVAAVLLAEYVVVALLAATGGLALAWLAAPLASDPSAGLLGRPGAPSLDLGTVALVTAVAVGVAVAATFVPAVRATRISTVRALAAGARAPRRLPWLIALSARLPIPWLLGLRVAARRPRRLVLATASVAIAVSGVVAAMSAHADIGGSGAVVDPARQGRLDQVLLVITITLLALAAVNAIVVAWATALDAAHSSAVARALGATPRQVGAGLSVGQFVPALAGALLGLPAGIALISMLDDDPTFPPLWQLLAVVPVTVLVIAGLTAVPAHLGTRRPVAEILQSERA